MSSSKDFLDVLDGIIPPDPDAPTIGSGAAFNDSKAGIPAMGPPWIQVTIPEEDGETVEHGRGKLVYYGQGGRKFFGYYSTISLTKEGSTITLTGTLKEE